MKQIIPEILQHCQKMAIVCKVNMMIVMTLSVSKNKAQYVARGSSNVDYYEALLLQLFLITVLMQCIIQYLHS